MPWQQMPPLPWWPRCVEAVEKGGSGSLEAVLGLSSAVHVEGQREQLSRLLMVFLLGGGVPQCKGTEP